MKATQERIYLTALQERREISDMIIRRLWGDEYLRKMACKLSQSQWRKLAIIFRDAENLDDLDKHLTTLIKKMSSGGTEDRKEKAKLLSKLKGTLLDAVFQEFNVSLGRIYEKPSADSRANLFLKKEIFSRAFCIYRYLASCEEWEKEREEPCLNTL